MVGDGDGAEVGLAGFGAEAGEFGVDDLDFVVAVGGGIGEGFQLVVFGHHLFVLLLVCAADKGYNNSSKRADIHVF